MSGLVADEVRFPGYQTEKLTSDQCLSTVHKLCCKYDEEKVVTKRPGAAATSNQKG